MKSLKHLRNKKRILVSAVLIVAMLVSAVFCARYVANRDLVIDTKSDNYGRFIVGTDNDYFSTRDQNVRNIIRKYLMWGSPDQVYGMNNTGNLSIGNLTDAQKYNQYLVYYYDSQRFIVADKNILTDDSSISGFTLHNIIDGKRPYPDCAILPRDGWYHSDDLLLSLSQLNPGGIGGHEGVCFYQRGDASFTFVDLNTKLNNAESIFNNDQTLDGTIESVDTTKRILTISIFDTTRKNASGNYLFKRSLKVSY